MRVLPGKAGARTQCRRQIGRRGPAPGNGGGAGTGGGPSALRTGSGPAQGRDGGPCTAGICPCSEAIWDENGRRAEIKQTLRVTPRKTEPGAPWLRILLHERSRHYNVEWISTPAGKGRRDWNQGRGGKTGIHRPLAAGCQGNSPSARQGWREAFGSRLATGGTAVPGR